MKINRYVGRFFISLLVCFVVFGLAFVSKGIDFSPESSGFYGVVQPATNNFLNEPSSLGSTCGQVSREVNVRLGDKYCQFYTNTLGKPNYRYVLSDNCYNVINAIREKVIVVDDSNAEDVAKGMFKDAFGSALPLVCPESCVSNGGGTSEGLVKYEKNGPYYYNVKEWLSCKVK